MPTKLTEAVVKHAKPGRVRKTLTDSEVTGLQLRITPKGHKSWSLWLRELPSKKSKTITLGPYPTLSLSMARMMARDFSAKNLLTLLTREHDSKESSLTFLELADRFLEEYAAKRHGDHGAYTRNIVTSSLKRFHNLKLGEMNRRMVRAWHEEMPEGDGGQPWANRSLQTMRRIFNWAIAEEITAANPADRIPYFREESRHRVLTPDEITQIWAALSAADTVASRALKLMLVTAQRKNEVLKARWRDLVPEGRVLWWNIYETKNGIPHRIPLLGLAQEVIAPQHEARAEYIFPTDRAGTRVGYLANPMKCVDVVRRQTGIADWTPHDLRRTASSRMAGLGVTQQVLRKILNHQEPGVTAVYDRYAYAREKVKAFEAWEGELRRFIRRPL
jgi:integrase